MSSASYKFYNGSKSQRVFTYLKRINLFNGVPLLSRLSHLNNYQRATNLDEAVAPILDWQIRENGLGPEAPVERFDPGQELRSVVNQGLVLGIVRGSTPTSRHDDDVIGGWLADQRRGREAATDPKAGGLSPDPVFEDVAVAVEL